MAPYGENELDTLLDSDPGFRLAMRGYDKIQVDNYVTQSEVRLISAQAACDAALRAHAEVAVQLSSYKDDIERLKQQIELSSKDPDPSRISDQVRQIMQLAADEAAKNRAALEAEGDKQLAQARDAVEVMLQNARTDAKQIIDNAIAERNQLNAEAKAGREKAERLSAERRTSADTEAQQTLATARAAATAQIAQADKHLADTRATAETVLQKANMDAKQLTEIALAERTQLNAEAKAAREKAEHISAERRTSAENRAREVQEDAEKTAAALLGSARAQVKDLNQHRDRTFSALSQLEDKLRSALEVAQQAAAEDPDTPRAAEAGGPARVPHGPHSSAARAGHDNSRDPMPR
jgi:vacuolar-type H+-ATPase subunit I/STV1